jgi:hypothetical protein
MHINKHKLEKQIANDSKAQKAKVSFEKEVSTKSDDELFRITFKMINRFTRPLMKDKIYEETKKEIYERAKELKTLDEILAKYTDSIDFMKLWNALGLNIQNLINIAQEALTQ